MAYLTAAVCRRGHVETTWAERMEYGARCAECGAEVLTNCTACGHRIRGPYRGDYGDYDPPDFCDACGAPHPWLSRRGRIFLLQNMLDDEDIEEAAKLRAREQLEALVSPDLDEDEAQKRWVRFKKAAPSLWAAEKAQIVINTLLEASTRAMVDKYSPQWPRLGTATPSTTRPATTSG